MNIMIKLLKEIKEKFKKHPIIMSLKALGIVSLTAVILWIVFFDFFGKIENKTKIRSFNNIDQYSIIKGNESNVYQVSVNYNDFYSIAFHIIGEVNSDINVKLTSESTQTVYYNNDISAEQLSSNPEININADESDAAKKRFPKGTYDIEITNLGDTPVNIVMRGDSGDSIDVEIEKKTDIGYKLGAFTFIVMVIYLLVLIFFDEKSIDAPKFFLISAIPMVLIFFLLITPFNTPDAGTHFLATYRWSNVILGHSGDEEWLARGDDGQVFIYGTREITPNPSLLCYSTYKDNIRLVAEDTAMYDMMGHEDRMKFYSLINYFPLVLGITIGRILHLGGVLSIYLAKFFMMIVYVLGCYHAVKTTPVAKSIFAMIPLLPISLVMSSAFSYDGMVMIVTLNLIASVFALYKDPTSKRYMIETIIWAFLTGAVKGGGYLLLLPIVLILFDFNDKKASLKRIIGIIISGVVSLVIFNVILPSGQEFFQMGIEGNGKMTAAFALHSPIQYIKMCVATYERYIDYLFLHMFGSLICWGENSIPVVVVLLIAIVGCVYGLYEKDEIKFKRTDKIIFYFIVFLSIISTPAMLLSWTDLGSPTIEGLQGRYYLAVLPILLMAWTKFSLHTDIADTDEERANHIKKKSFIIMGVLLCMAVYYMEKVYFMR